MHACGALRLVSGCTRRQNNVGGVTAGQAPHNSSNVGVVTAGQVGHNSSNNNTASMVPKFSENLSSAVHRNRIIFKIQSHQQVDGDN